MPELTIAVFIALLSPAALIALVLWRAGRETTDRFVDEWSRAHDLATTDRNRPLVKTYLHNARMLRTIGVLGVGFVLPTLAGMAFGFMDSGNGFDIPPHWSYVFGGHLVGAFYAEVVLRRPVPAGPRSASLSPRRLDQYLPRWMIVLPWAMALAVLAAAGGLSARQSLSAGQIGIGVVAVALPVAILRAQRWVLDRPQPFTEPDLVAADDAIRSQSVHMFAGSGSAVLATLLGSIATDYHDSVGDLDVVDSVMLWVAALSWLTALVLCLFTGHRRWAVTRTGFSTPIDDEPGASDRSAAGQSSGRSSVG